MDTSSGVGATCCRSLGPTENQALHGIYNSTTYVLRSWFSERLTTNARLRQWFLEISQVTLKQPW